MAICVPSGGVCVCVCHAVGGLLCLAYAGTPQWMAPEVMEGHSYSGKVDVYAFGIVMCEMFSRIVPFSGQCPTPRNACVACPCRDAAASARVLPWADVYRRFDFIDAVLEEGALPTIPIWCDITRHNKSNRMSNDSSDEEDRSVDDASSKDNVITGETASSSSSIPTIRHSQSIWDCDVGAVMQLATVAKKVLTTLDVPASAALQFAAEVASAHSRVYPASRWGVGVGQCSGVLSLLIEACLSRYDMLQPQLLVELRKCVRLVWLTWLRAVCACEGSDPDNRPEFLELVDLLRDLLAAPRLECEGSHTLLHAVRVPE